MINYFGQLLKIIKTTNAIDHKLDSLIDIDRKLDSLIESVGRLHEVHHPLKHPSESQELQSSVNTPQILLGDSHDEIRPEITQEDKDVASAYNNKQDIGHSKTEVNITEDSMNAIRAGNPQRPTIFELMPRRGSYHIISLQERKYLVPKPDMKITEFTLQSLQTSFECQGYTSDSDSFSLVKPGKVDALRKEEWQLVELGILQFQSS